MVLEILPDARKVDDDPLNTSRLEDITWPNATELKDLRRMNSPSRHNHLPFCRHGGHLPLEVVCRPERNPSSSTILHYDPNCLGVCDEVVVSAFQIAVVPRSGIRSLAELGVHELRVPEDARRPGAAVRWELHTWHFLPCVELRRCPRKLERRPTCVDTGSISPEIGIVNNARLLGDVRVWGHKGMRLLKVEQHLLPAPLRIISEELAPAVVVAPGSPDGHHGIDGGATANHLPGQYVDDSVVEVNLRNRAGWVEQVGIEAVESSPDSFDILRVAW